HDAILIKKCGKHTNSTFPIHVYRIIHGGEMPIIFTRTDNSASVPSTVHIASGFIGNRIMRLVLIGTKGMISDVYAIPIYIKLGTWRLILHVIFVVMLGEPWPLDIPTIDGVTVIFTKSFPSMLFCIEVEELHDYRISNKTLVFVEFASANGIYIR